MLKKFALITCCALLPVMAQAQETAPAADKLSPELQKKFSYAVGRDIAKSFQSVRDAINLDALKEGLDDAYLGRPGPFTDVELQTTKGEMGKILQARMQAAELAAAETNLKAASDFLKKNGARKGVVTTASGLQYEVLIAGKGDHPKLSSNVTVHYRGTLENGNEFDSSYARKEPTTFALEGVIPGWIEALQLMRVGAKYKLFVPPALAYGETGVSPVIGPNTLLIFEVELLSFETSPLLQ